MKYQTAKLLAAGTVLAAGLLGAGAQTFAQIRCNHQIRPLDTYVAVGTSPEHLLVGEWTGVAARRPDAGPPVSVRLRVAAQRADSLFFDVTIPESRQIALAVPSPYSNEVIGRLLGDSLHVEFTADIGLGFIGGLVPPDSERIVLAGRVRGDAIVGTVIITRYSSPITLRRVQQGGSEGERTVTFTSTQDGLRLGGTLLLPSGRGPFPAAVFVTGSDPDTRESWQIEARALRDRGIASLIYDKRGVGESKGASHDLASWDDLAGDVEGAVAFLRGLPELDPARVGLIGQSQGTWIITKVAARDRAVSFLVLISGGGMSAAEQETYRTGAMMRRDGLSPDEIARAVAFQRQKFAVARSGIGWEALDSTMQRLRTDSIRWFPRYGTGAAVRSLAVLRLYGVLQFNYDPRPDLARIQTPLLVIMGADDVVFPPDTVIQRVRNALSRANRPNPDAMILPRTSHGMMVLQTVGGAPFRRVISDDFVRALVDWVVQKVK